MSGGPWSLRIASSGRRDLRRLDPQVRSRVLAALERLRDDPEQASGVKKLAGRREIRLRVGDWRVIFQLDRKTRTVHVLRVLPRGRAYR